VRELLVEVEVEVEAEAEAEVEVEVMQAALWSKGEKRQ
jgi:hypothetical protein